MYIEPNTNIKILKNCPVDADFTNTLWFESPNEQTQYFTSLTKYNLTNYSYQRVNKGVARVGIQAENLYDCNYMMFQNTAFGNKWFYAFVDKIEYVNNVTSEISFTIDPMQTWLFEHSVNRCFVEREHATSDGIGDNLVPENVNLGQYIIEDIEQPSDWNDMERVIVVASTDWWDGSPDSPQWHEGTGAGVVGGIFSGIHFKIIVGINETVRVANASIYLEKFAEAGRVESILGVWETYRQYVTEFTYYDQITTQRGSTLNGYTPKNKKLLTFPYCYLEGATGDGNRHTYMYEYFTNPDEIEFTIIGSFNGTASLGMYPLNYKGAHPNYDEILSYESASVQCAYTTDSFKAWLAQNSYNMTLRTGETLQLPKGTMGKLFTGFMGGGAMGGLTGALVGLGASALNIITDLLQKEDVTPNSGRLGSGSAVNHLLKTDTFRINRKCITREFAIIIDDFFNRYGYATNRVKEPNRSSRPHWNYVKTVGCTINGSIPADDEKKICSIYDNGVTFWKNPTEVGHYELNNSPT